MPGRLAETRVVFEEELNRHVRRPSWVIVTLGVPVLLALAWLGVSLYGVLSGEGEAPKPIGYLDLSGEVTGLQMEGFRSFPSREAGIEAALQSEIEHFFIVPEDVVSTGEVTWLTPRSGVFAGESARDRFASFLSVALIADRLEAPIADRLLTGFSFDQLHIGEGGAVEPETDEFSRFAVPLVLTIALMLSLFIGAGTLVQSVSDEKENRMVEVLLTSVSPLALMSGKILALGAASLGQMVVWVLSLVLIGARVISQTPLEQLSIDPATLVFAGLYFLVGYFLFAAILGTIGAATTSSKEAGPLTAVVTIPALIPIYASSVINSAPDTPLVTAISFFPLTAPTTMMLRMGAGNASVAEATASLAVTAAAMLAMLVVSARVFRAGMLLYGQRMTLQGVWKALRQAS